MPQINGPIIKIRGCRDTRLAAIVGNMPRDVQGDAQKLHDFIHGDIPAETYEAVIRLEEIGALRRFIRDIERETERANGIAETDTGPWG